MREIIYPKSMDEACERYVNDLKLIIDRERKFPQNKPILMLSGGVDSFMLGALAKKYYGLEHSITVGVNKDSKDIVVSQDTASQLDITNELIFISFDEVIDNLHLCKGKGGTIGVTSVFSLVYYLVFYLCLKQTDIREVDLLQGDGADTLLGSIQTFMYAQSPNVMEELDVDKDTAKTVLKQRHYVKAINPNKTSYKGAGHLFLELAKELGANPIMPFKHSDVIRWVNDLHYGFSRPDKKLLHKKFIEYLGYDPKKVKRGIMQIETGIYKIVQDHMMQITGAKSPNSGVVKYLNGGRALPGL